MSLSSRRESLLKSSISIKSMRDSVAKFNKGLNAAKKCAIEIVKNTKESNLFKKTLISKDNNFFRKRQENVGEKLGKMKLKRYHYQVQLNNKDLYLQKAQEDFLEDYLILLEYY